MSDMVTTGQTALNGKPHDDDDYAEARDVTGGIEGELRCRVLRGLAFGSCPLVYILYIERNT